MWYSLYHQFTSYYFLHLSQDIVSRHRDQFAHRGKTANASFKEIKGKVTVVFFHQNILSGK